MFSTLAAMALSSCASASEFGAGSSEPQTVRIVGPGGATTTLATALPVNRVSVVRLPFKAAAVWSVLPDVYESLGIELTDIDSGNLTIGNGGFKVRRRLGDMPLQRYLDCGSTQGGPNAENYDVHMSVISQVQEATLITATISTSVIASARPVMFAGAFSACTTTGSLEARLVERIKARLQ